MPELQRPAPLRVVDLSDVLPGMAGRLGPTEMADLEVPHMPDGIVVHARDMVLREVRTAKEPAPHDCPSDRDRGAKEEPGQRLLRPP